MDYDEALGVFHALDTLIGRLDRWSDRCIAAGSFPPDTLKRAAG
jgi:hypothetical protein